MIKINNLIKWGSVVFVSFGCGLIFHYTFGDRTPVRVTQQNKHGQRSTTPELSIMAKEKYKQLMSEYADYISNDQNKYIGFKEFISIRKDTLVQNKKYSASDIDTDEEIKRWLNSYTDQRSNNPVETNRYSIYGAVISPYKSKNECFIVVNIYNLPIIDFSPSVPANSISPENPIASTFLDDCSGGSFELDFLMSNIEDAETGPVYIAAYAFDGSISSYNTPIAYGSDEHINGVPPSLLAKRKNNEPIKISLKPLSKFEQSNVNINIKSKSGLWVAAYGSDSIAKLAPDLNTYRVVISARDDIARLNSLPFGSNVYVQIFDPNKEHKIGLFIPTSANKLNIELPKKILNIQQHGTNPSIVVVPPNNMANGEITISSMRSLKNKGTMNFNDITYMPLILDDADPQDTLIELKQNNKSLGITSIRPKKNEILIVNPTPKKIQKLSGSLSLMNNLITDLKPCSRCTLEIKYTDKSSITKNNGTFNIEDINIIDDQLELLIEEDDNRFIVPLVVHHNIKKLNLNLELPSKRLISSWNKIEPTLPINGLVYGNYTYHKSYRVFLRSIEEVYQSEAMYFDDDTMQPKRDKYSTSEIKNKAGFASFVFNDVPSGNYVIYMIAGTNILHTRYLHVEPGTTTVIY